MGTRPIAQGVFGGRLAGAHRQANHRDGLSARR
nr:MAG TPA: hypothetical protein [Caudoviricetes sp.]